jgi:hypothetical protein
MKKPQDTKTAPAIVECAVCKKQIPPSVAISPEADEYVLYFCGGKCHAQWEREQATKLERAFAHKSGVKR